MCAYDILEEKKTNRPCLLYIHIFLLTFYPFLFAVGQSKSFGFGDLNLSVLCHHFSSLTPKNNHLQCQKDYWGITK